MSSDAIVSLFNRFHEKINEGILKINDQFREDRKKRSYEHLDIIKNGIKFSPTSTCLNLNIGEKQHILVGKCSRAVFFNYAKVPKTNPATPENIAKMEMGNAIETQRQNYLKASGYMTDVNTRYLIKIFEDLHLSIETDGTIKDPELGNIVWECKSTYEKGAREVFGTKTIPGHPKWEYCMQMMSYLIGLSGKYPIYQLNEETKKLEEIEALKPLYCVNETIDRAAGGTKTFIVFIMLHTASGLIVASPEEIQNADPANLYPGWYDREHDRIDYISISFKSFIDAAYTDGKVINNCKLINRDENGEINKDASLPPRKARYQYPSNQIEYMYNAKLISKYKYEGWKKQGTPIGDFQCRYCDWKDLCIGVTPWIESTIPQDNAVLEQAEKLIKQEEKKEI